MTQDVGARFGRLVSAGWRPGRGDRRDRLERGGEGRLEAEITRSKQRDPDDRGRRLQGPRLRLRLRARRGQHLHDRRRLRDRRTPSARATSAPTRTRPRASPTSTPTSSTQRINDARDRRGPASKRSRPPGPKPDGQAGDQRLRQGLQPLPRQDRGRQHPRPDLRRRRLGAPITKIDAYRRFYELGALRQPGRRRSTGSPTPQPPAAPRAGARRRRPTAPTGAELGSSATALDLCATRAPTAGASAGEATKKGSGMVLANPHFPWSGPRALLPVAPA